MPQQPRHSRTRGCRATTHGIENLSMTIDAAASVLRSFEYILFQKHYSKAIIRRVQIMRGKSGAVNLVRTGCCISFQDHQHRLHKLRPTRHNRIACIWLRRLIPTSLCSPQFGKRDNSSTGTAKPRSRVRADRIQYKQKHRSWAIQKNSRPRFSQDNSYGPFSICSTSGVHSIEFPSVSSSSILVGESSFVEYGSRI